MTTWRQPTSTRSRPSHRRRPLAVGILASVVGLAALNVLPVVIAALAGVVAMVVTGYLTTADAYDAVSWNVIFLLAGVITPVAATVLMIPVGVDAAARLGANEFGFLLAVMFASATSFMTPVGYQTN